MERRFVGIGNSHAPVITIPTTGSKNIELAYSEEVYGLLEEMGLASVNPDRYSNGWSLHDPLRAGKWHYDADQSEFFTSSIPLLSAITRSSTNVDMCDSHFQTSYLVSYISGSDEHQLLSISGSKNIKEVLIRTEEHAHEKIASCRKIVKEKEAKNPHLGRKLVSLKSSGLYSGSSIPIVLQILLVFARCR